MDQRAAISTPIRRYVQAEWQLSDWASVQPYWDQLVERALPNKEALEQWLQDWSELEAILSEEVCWRQINMTRDTENKAYEEAFGYFVSEVEPHIKPYADKLNQKLIQHPDTKHLDAHLYFPYLRGIQNQIDLYRAENIPLASQISLLAQQYGAISGAMTVSHEQTTLTIQQATAKMHSDNRALRKELFETISARRLQDKDALDDLFDQLLQLRHQVAINAGFDNYRDYKFRELGRFDYTVADCEAFHEAVKTHIVPLQEQMLEHKRQALNIDALKPFDLVGEPQGQQPLKPFTNGNELLEKTIAVFEQLRPFYADCLKTMQVQERLDLESRIGKAPGGYNCPLAETGVPFIFMNAAGTVDDVITMMHEGGHAVHSFLSHPLKLNAFKEYPMEIAELASMSMELFTLEHWHIFFNDPAQLKRAQTEELERAIDVLPWIATIDKFQHWLYTHPGHSKAERTLNWLRIVREFAPKNVDWSDYEDYQSHYWQKQLHLFEVPFYYIEYGIAQLGAIAMWRQYKQNAASALDNYERALAAGYTKTLKQLYETAGIAFDFSPKYIQELAAFVQNEMKIIGGTHE